MLLADNSLLLGDKLLPSLLLALGAAMVVGYGLALLRPPEKPKKGELKRAPFGRTVLMMAFGAVIAVWAGASLFTK